MKKFSKILCVLLVAVIFFGAVACSSDGSVSFDIYSIRYDLDGGVNDDSNPTFYTQESEFVFVEPEKEGYSFVGWQCNGESITEIKKGSKGDLKLSAVWKENSVDTNFDRVIKTDGQTYMGGEVVYPTSLWSEPEWNYESDLDFASNPDGVKGLFFTSVPYGGKPTRVCAYMGVPQGASANDKVPAIVLVHGAGGTAIPEWVKYWNDKGYAAISLDLEGAEPVDGVSNADPKHNARNRYDGDSEYTAGPTNLAFGDGDKEITEQWCFHATSAVIGATSLIASLDCVDGQKIGITGISWGSVISSIVIGYDDRLTFGMPVYGGVSIDLSCSGFENLFYENYSTEDARLGDKMKELWDTLEPLKQTNCKTFFVTGTEDFAFSMDIASRCAEASNGRVLYKSDFAHSQINGALEENLVTFANSVCGKKEKAVDIIKHPDAVSPTVKVERKNGAVINLIRLYYTFDEKTNGDTEWQFITVPASRIQNEFSLPMPSCANAFVRITYDNGQVCSYIAGNKFLEDDFTAIGVGEIRATERSNLITDANGHKDYGLVPGSVWGGFVSGGDGYLTYKVTADENKSISTATVSVKVGVGHQGSAYWYNSSRQGEDTLGANLIIYVSRNNSDWIKVYDLDEDEGHPIRNKEEAQDNILCPTADLSPYIDGWNEMYIKIYVKHFNVEQTKIDGWKDNGIALGNVGIMLYSVNYVCTQI